MMARRTMKVGYFGKLATRSDFVKAGDNHVLAELLDQWLADAMTELSSNPRWKLHYDALRPLHFAFVGTRSRRAVAGHLAASADQSRRRYPFITMGALEVDEPDGFLAASPVHFERLWAQLAQHTQSVLTASDAHDALRALANATPELGAIDDQRFPRFLAATSLAQLEAAMAAGSVRRQILALGLLLQPFRWSGNARLEKSLAIRLPAAADERALAASWWLSLAILFFGQLSVELALFIVESEGRAQLVLGFNGAEPCTLQAIIDPEFAAVRQIRLDQAEWVDEAIAGNGRLQQLSACLGNDTLTLGAASQLFAQCFN
jgi:type VI secretion system protein ImpM